MDNCPRKTCTQEEKVDGMRRTLYGRDGSSGLVFCTKKFVTRNQIWVGFVAIVIPLFIGAYTIYSKAEARIYQLELTTAVNAARVEAGIETLNKNIESLQYSITEAVINRKELSKAIETLSRELMRFNGTKKEGN